MNAKPPMTCPRCGAAMNHHALIEANGEGVTLEIHACPNCGHIESRETEAT